MKQSFLGDTFKWGFILACITSVIPFVVPMSNKYDSDVILIFIPVVGFVCGVIVVILNFLASEAIKYSEYRLTKVEGVGMVQSNCGSQGALYDSVWPLECRIDVSAVSRFCV